MTNARTVKSASNPLIKRLMKLRTSKKQRAIDNAFVLSGYSLAAEVASFAPITARRALLTDGFHLPPNVSVSDEIVHTSTEAMCKASGVERVLGDLGCLLEIDLPMHSFISSGAKLAAPSCYSVVLDAVSDPGNVGTLMRSASALGWRTVVACNGTADFFADKCIRAGRGAPLKMHSLGVMSDIGSVLSEAKHNGANVLIADDRSPDAVPVQHSPAPIAANNAPSNGVVLVLGSEGEGVSEQALHHATTIVKIDAPHGDGCPLNVSAAGAILMHLFAPSLACHTF